MASRILSLLGQKNLSLKEVSEKSSVPVSNLSKAAKKPIESWPICILNAFAKRLDEEPGELLNILQPQ